jgi:tubulin alpha
MNAIYSGMEDCADNFARGHNTIGYEVIELAENYLRRIVERCSSLQGFFLFHATGGGTGSGLGALLLERMSVDYGDKIKFTFTVNSSRQIGNSVTEPYNSILSTHSLLEHIHASFNIDNESLYKVATNSLKISCPTYRNLNRIIAQVASSITLSLRSKESNLNMSLQDMLTNLVPYPRIHSLITSYAPLIAYDEQYYEDGFSVNQMTDSVLRFNFLSCRQSEGKYLACCLLYRGDVTPHEVSDAVSRIKSNNHSTHSSRVRFVDWVPTGFKCSISTTTQQSATQTQSAATTEFAPVSRSCCMVANNTCIVQSMANIHHKFDLLFAKRAFVHWYCGEVNESSYSLCSVHESTYAFHVYNVCVSLNI